MPHIVIVYAVSTRYARAEGAVQGDYWKFKYESVRPAKASIMFHQPITGKVGNELQNCPARKKRGV